MKIFLISLLIAICLPTWGQHLMEEVPTIAALKARNASSINKSVHVRGYWREGDGGGGDFIVTNSVSDLDNGLKIRSSQNLAFSYLRQVSGGVSPKWFGAVGNGTSNDTVRLQEAITQGTVKGYSIDLGVGSYLITAALVPTNNTMIFGSGDKSVIIGMSAINILQMTGITNVVLRDFNLAGTSGVSIYATNCTGLYFQRIKQSGASIALQGYTAGIEIEGGGNVTLDNVECSGNGRNTMVDNLDYDIVSGFFNTTTTNLVILNPTIRNQYSKLGIALFNSVNPKIRDGFIDMNMQGTTNNADGYGIAIYGKTGIAEAVRASVIGTTITNLYGSGILFRNILDGEIIGCQIAKSSQLCSDFGVGQGAITITKGQRIRVVNNGIYNSGINSGIEFDSTTNCIISGNSISLPGTNRWGIEIRGQNFGASIKGNTIENAHRAIGTTIGNGIADTLDIEGNFIRNVVDGIFLSGDSSNTIVRANRVYNNSGTGITDLGSYDTFLNNYVLGGILGVSLAGTNGIFSLNLVGGQVTGINISGNGYRFTPDNQYFNNTVPIIDSGGALVKILTSGAYPSVRDSAAYRFNYSTPTSVTNFADGFPGIRRTFTSANTNVTIIHSTQVTLDGAGDFNMQPGDVLTIERDDTGAWRQVGKSIDSNWTYMDRAAGNYIINARLFNRGPVSISTPPSTNTYALDVQNPTNTPGTLIFRAGTINRPNGITLRADSSGTNFTYEFNGVAYTKPLVQGAANTVEVNDGSGNLLWRPVSSLYNFDSNFNVTSGTNIALASQVLARLYNFNTNFTASSTTNISLSRPIPVADGGTGRDLSGGLDGAIPFYESATGKFTTPLLSAYTNFLTWSKSTGLLNLSRTNGTSNPFIQMTDGSGSLPVGTLYSDKFSVANTNLSLDSLASSIRARINSVTGLELNADLSVIAGGGSTVTTRTNQFLYIPTSAGPPTGVPNPQAGWAALTFDTVNTNLYIYDAGAWNKIRLQ